jgi:alpha-tubulin suppressor-like RCC1 family protein
MRRRLLPTLGHDHACVVHDDATVSCWGKDDWGQLGDPTLPPEREIPTAVEGVEGVAGITAGFAHTGSGSSGELGDGNQPTAPTGEVVSVTGLASVLEIRAGVYRTCARLPANRIFCWGDAHFATLGNLTLEYSATPVEIEGIEP